MASPFDRDRTLRFNHCEFETVLAPTNIFLNTEREYKRLVLGREANFTNTMDKNFFNNSLKGLKSIEFEHDFDYKKFFSSTNFFLKQFNQLKDLTLNVDAWEFTKNEFGDIPSSVETFTLVLLGPSYFESSLGSFKSLIWNMPNLRKLNLECRFLTDDLFGLFITTNLEALTTLKLNIDLESERRLVKLRCPNLKELFLVIKDPQVVTCLDEIMSNFSSLTTIKLDTYKIMPQSANAHLIKYLKVTDINCGMDYVKPLQFLTELEELDLRYYFKSVAQGNCFFAHDPYFNRKLKRLHLYGFNNSDLISLMCFENLVKSFPNLELLIMDMPLFSQHLQMINQHFTKLKCLIIRNTDVESRYVPPLKYFLSLSELHLEQYIITDETLQEWPKMPHLRRLSLKLDHNYTLENFDKMIRNVAGIENLSFNYTSSISDELIKIVADNCRRLRGIKVEKCQKTDRLTRDSVAYLQKQCLFLKIIRFPFVEIFIGHADHFSL